jgi:hypothetical protein
MWRTSEEEVALSATEQEELSHTLADLEVEEQAMQVNL